MEFKSTFIAILIFSMIMIAASLIVSEWADVYSSGITPDLQEFDKSSTVIGQAETQKGKINPQSGEASSDFETETFRGGYGILTNIFSPLRTIYGEGGMIDAIGTRFGLPTWLIQIVSAAIIIAIIFTLLAIIFRQARPSV